MTAQTPDLDQIWRRASFPTRARSLRPSAGCQHIPELQTDAISDQIATARWLYGCLLRAAAGHDNDAALACMIASQSTGSGALPRWLGLEPDAFRALLDHHFPGLGLEQLPEPTDHDRLDPARQDEREALIELMCAHHDEQLPSAGWIAQIVAAGCMGSDHLWQDLGLWNRADLTALMHRNFPALAARNVKDMKWKRFLYKQLCEAEDVVTCRAPSCEGCCDYHVCFGPEN